MAGSRATFIDFLGCMWLVGRTLPALGLQILFAVQLPTIFLLANAFFTVLFYEHEAVEGTLLSVPQQTFWLVHLDFYQTH